MSGLRHVTIFVSFKTLQRSGQAAYQYLEQRSIRHIIPYVTPRPIPYFGSYKSTFSTLAY